MRPLAHLSIACCAVIAVVVLMVGCSQLPTAPSGRDHVDFFAAERSAGRGAQQQGPGTGGSDSVVTSTPLDSVLVSQAVDGQNSCTMQAGRFMLDIPRGAIDGPATIKMATTTGGGRIDLHIVPEDRNQFAVPVILSLDLTHVSPAARADIGIFWIDPVSGDWVLVEGSTLDPRTHILSAPLSHFSSYVVGCKHVSKAGW